MGTLASESDRRLRNLTGSGGFHPLDMPSTGARADITDLLADLRAWRMAGEGCFVADGDGVRSEGGPGLFWDAGQEFADFALDVDWRSHALTDNSGVFIRAPPLGSDWRPAVEQGYEIQIDDRGYDPATQRTGSPLHLSGAIYRLAPANRLMSRPVGEWNSFRILAQDAIIAVFLNGVETARLTRDLGRRRSGHIALQCHHPGSRVQFRHMRIERLS